MKKLAIAAQSRTVLIFVILFVTAGFEGVRELIPEAIQMPLFGFLSLLGAYFRVNPRV